MYGRPLAWKCSSLGPQAARLHTSAKREYRTRTCGARGRRAACGPRRARTNYAPPHSTEAMLECAAMTISFSDRVTVPDDVLISHLQEESVILNLDSERYFGLDDVGTRFLSALTTSESIEAACEQLSEEYDVDNDVLRRDLLALVEDLVNKGLLISNNP